MKPAETILDSWAERQWSWAVGIVFGGQLLLVLLLSNHTPGTSSPTAAVTTFSLALDSVSNERLNDPLLLGDPTLFALANPRGFSGRAWLKAPSLEHAMVAWTEPPGWLPATFAQLGGVFVRFVETNATAPFRVTDQPAPLLTELAVTPESSPQQSILRVEGALKARPLASQPALPVWSHGDVLRASVLQILVQPDGEIFSATLLSGSGLKAADDGALKLAGTIRFQPLKPAGASSPAGFSTGTLIFNWHTVVPAAAPPP